MHGNQLREQVSEMRRALFDEGVLGDYFLSVETLEAQQPNFVENILPQYLAQSESSLNQLRTALETNPVNHTTVERLIQKLKGGSATIGAANFSGIIDEMWAVFKTGNIDQLYLAYLNVRAGLAVLKGKIEPYVELLRKLRLAIEAPVAPDEGSGVVGPTNAPEAADRDDLESVDSNHMDDD